MRPGLRRAIRFADPYFHGRPRGGRPRAPGGRRRTPITLPPTTPVVIRRRAGTETRLTPPDPS